MFILLFSYLFGCVSSLDCATLYEGCSFEGRSYRFCSNDNNEIDSSLTWSSIEMSEDSVVTLSSTDGSYFTFETDDECFDDTSFSFIDRFEKIVDLTKVDCMIDSQCTYLDPSSEGFCSYDEIFDDPNLSLFNVEELNQLNRFECSQVTVEYGGWCARDEHCKSKLCVNGMCMECTDDIECPEEGFCRYDDFYDSNIRWRCSPVKVDVGGWCKRDTHCGGIGDSKCINNKCYGCLDDSMCPTGAFCQLHEHIDIIPNFFCLGTLFCNYQPMEIKSEHSAQYHCLKYGSVIFNGPCESNSQCSSNICVGGRCHQCSDDSQCDHGYCQLEELNEYDPYGDPEDYKSLLVLPIKGRCYDLLPFGSILCRRNSQCKDGYCPFFDYPSSKLGCVGCVTDEHCPSNSFCRFESTYDTEERWRCSEESVTLGNKCWRDRHCATRSCVDGVCVKCSNDIQCPGGFCRSDDIYDTPEFSALDRWTCSPIYVPLGNKCWRDGHCETGSCENGKFGSPVCVECSSDEQCPSEGFCRYDDFYDTPEFAALDRWTCSPIYVTLGNKCWRDGHCETGSCENGKFGSPVCVECSSDEQCPSEGFCRYDDIYDTPEFPALDRWTCSYTSVTLGNKCWRDGHCFSSDLCVEGLCQPAVNGGDKEHECTDDSMCQDDYFCQLDEFWYILDSLYLGDFYIDEDPYKLHEQYTCIPKEETKYYVFNEWCTRDAGCVSNVCVENQCLDCREDSHCKNGFCKMDVVYSKPPNYFSYPTQWLCSPLVALGKYCLRDGQCASGNCLSKICVECVDDSSCPSDGFCHLEENRCYSTTLGIGEWCNADEHCSSGKCVEGKCVECYEDSMCPTSGYCREDSTCSPIGLEIGAMCLRDRYCESKRCVDEECVWTELSSEMECVDDDECNQDIGRKCFTEPLYDEMESLNRFECSDGAGPLELCFEDHHCEEGRCIKNKCECFMDEECDEGNVCVEGVCFPPQSDSQYFTSRIRLECKTGIRDCDQDDNDVEHCTLDDDCDDLQFCLFEDQAISEDFCISLFSIGDICLRDGNCFSGRCDNHVCSECRNNDDCLFGEYCQKVQHTTYFQGVRSEKYSKCTKLIEDDLACSQFEDDVSFADESCSSGKCLDGLCAKKCPEGLYYLPEAEGCQPCPYISLPDGKCGFWGGVDESFYFDSDPQYVIFEFTDDEDKSLVGPNTFGIKVKWNPYCYLYNNKHVASEIYESLSLNKRISTRRLQSLAWEHYITEGWVLKLSAEGENCPVVDFSELSDGVFDVPQEYL